MQGEIPELHEPRTYRVSEARRRPLVEWIAKGLTDAGCRLLHVPSADSAPFRFVFQAPDGERMGAMIYAFTATSVVTRNRPVDEWRFQIKYGSKDGELHDLWQDPHGLYTTLLIGIDPISGCFVGADPVLHSPTLMFISLEFKQRHMAAIQASGWHAWERESELDLGEPREVLVGGRPERILDYIRFERAAKGLDQGHRGLLAEHPDYAGSLPLAPATERGHIGVAEEHHLVREFEMESNAILDMVSYNPRLRMAARGWAAETHLVKKLREVPGVSDCESLTAEGSPDVALRFHGKPLTIECKNVLRQTTASGLPRLDFQRTRVSQGDKCTRYYRPADFDVVAACLHAITEQWEFRFRMTGEMEPHKVCAGRLSSTVRIDAAWVEAVDALEAAARKAQ